MDTTNIAGPVMGALLVEVFIACILYGITTLQTFIYYQGQPNDRPFLKCLVATVWLLETVHTAFCIQLVYDYLIIGFGRESSFLTIDWGVGITILCGASVGFCVQGYYTWRIWIVSNKSIFWTGIMGTFTLARVGFGIAACALCYIHPSWPALRSKKGSMAIVSGGLGSAALVDILFAVNLTVYLKRPKSAVSIQRPRETKTMVDQILLYAVNTGAITCSASILCVILFAIQKESLVFLGLFEIQAKLYSNSFLGSLNTREHIRGSSLHTSSSSTLRAGHPRVPMLEIYQHTVIEDDRPSRTVEGTHLNFTLPTKSGDSSKFKPDNSEFP